MKSERFHLSSRADTKWLQPPFGELAERLRANLKSGALEPEAEVANFRLETEPLVAAEPVSPHPPARKRTFWTTA